VEDDLTLLETLEYSLARRQYQVHKAVDGLAALEKARRERPDAIILDVMLPGMDGFEVCRILRQETNVPILMLTARTDVIDRVIGLEIGADDYLVKPFSMPELLARVGALLRRQRLIWEDLQVQGSQEQALAANPDVLSCGDLVINLARREALCHGTPLHLKPKEFDLLVFLVRNRNTVLSRDLLLERVWGLDYDGDGRTLDVHICWLRSKIEPIPAQPTYIMTVRGVGYRFEA
jgi:DNA-binding response OmpR family regulator